MTYSQNFSLVRRFWSVRQTLRGLAVPKRLEIEINLLDGYQPSSKTWLKSVKRLINRPSKQSLPFSKLANPAIQAFSKMLNFAAVVTMGISILVAGVVFGPKLYFSIFPAQPTQVIAQDSGSALGGEFSDGAQAAQADHNLPELDPNLPQGSWLVIPRIGVRTNLIQTDDPEQALNKGVWWVPEFGQPGDQDQPMILAAHRYGFRFMWETVLDNGDTYALRHIFYKLPETEPGDRIEIIHQQRRYVYEIYAGEEGHEITDYEADLILYTCKFIDSPVRFMRYARLINLTLDTQTPN